MHLLEAHHGAAVRIASGPQGAQLVGRVAQAEERPVFLREAHGGILQQRAAAHAAWRNRRCRVGAYEGDRAGVTVMSDSSAFFFQERRRLGGHPESRRRENEENESR